VDHSPHHNAAATSATDLVDPQLERHVADLRTRLRPICHDWDAAAFEELVLRMACTKGRGAATQSRG
jgi:hypothetical protein